MLQWTPPQVHDTVAAIARGPAFTGGGTQQSLFARFIRYLVQGIEELFGAMRGSLDARLIIYIAIAAVVVIVAGRIIADRQLADQRRRGIRPRGPRDRRDYWNLSRELAAGGRYADASHALYAAVLESMATSGAVKYHASKTSGDYARELRRRGSPMAADFRIFGREFDRAMYGTAEVSADRYEELAGMAERIVRAIQLSPAA